MKISHFVIYLFLNLLFVFVLNLLKLNIFLETFLVVLLNFLIIFFIQKQTISEISNLVERMLKTGEVKKDSDEDQASPIQAGYTKDMKNLIGNFIKINNELGSHSHETQKPLATSIEAILNSTLDGIIVINNERDIIMANESFFHLCGNRAFEISGKDSTSMISPENILSKNLMRFIKYSFENSILNQENISTGVIEITNLNSRKTLKVTATPLKYRQSTLDGLVINLKDISRELAADEEKNKFVTSISHEFRTPLFSIMGYASLIVNDQELDTDTVKNFAKTIYDESLQLSDITDNLLNVLFLDREDLNIKIEKLKLDDIFEGVAREFEQRLQNSNLKLLYYPDPNIDTIVNDRESISIIIKNLFSNAIKFSFPDKEIIINSVLEGDSVYISFTNSGPGISEANKGKIFEKFFRAESRVHNLPGTGLGLFITRRLARLHGGDVTFESTENEQTVFYLALPVISRFDKDKFNLIDHK
jgi:PAS domain S-box-containing protein